MPRTATVNPATRRRLLDAARRLMLERGYSGTSVDDICRAARVTKGAFFHWFPTKEELAGAAVRSFCEEMGTMFDAALAGVTDPVRRIERRIDAMIQFARNPDVQQGCLLGALAQEMCDCNPRFQSLCCDGFGAWIDTVEQELAAAKAAVAPRAPFRPRALAEHLIAVLEGSLILAKAKQDPEVVVESLKHFRAYLKTLLKA
ncbi:MAG: TetR/AcrR family transcriptional regulator [Candidatus Brocadiae bacterium]|nr:TetR/AcrR family transcriptional regulator [Candidatus Brocadiia bacterium]